MIFILYLFFIILHQLESQHNKFNYFKSYSDSLIKPPNYSREKKHLRHSIEEYLDTNQKRIHKIRNSPDTPDVMFRSGFNRKSMS